MMQNIRKHYRKDDDWMTIENMTLREKIGQLFIVGFPSTEYDDHIQKAIEAGCIGNIILFERNIKNLKQLMSLTTSIQKACMTHLKIPALISVDQEGGMVARIKKEATFLPGNMAFSAANGDTYKAGEIQGKELRALGINMNLAPSLDINNNPDNPVIGVRSYGEHKEQVATLGTDYICGLQKQVIATAKHFPGHGDTAVDSHLDLPTIKHDLKRIHEVELYPFKKAIASGVDAIMTAHVLFPSLEESVPATLSPKIVTDLLKKELGFKGLVVSDCMEMKAIKDHYGTVHAAVKSIKAGVDMLFVSHSLDLQLACVKAVEKAVLEGEILEERINEAVLKIIAMKHNYNLFDEPYPHEEKINTDVGIEDHTTFAQKVSEKSLTLLSTKGSLLPIKEENILTISTMPIGLTRINDIDRKEKSFSDYIKEELGGNAITIDLNPTQVEIDKVLEQVNDKDSIIIGLYNGHMFNGQINLVRQLYRLNKNLIIVALRNPYDFSQLKEVDATKICAYEYTPMSLKSLVRLLKGEIKAEGKLPVTI